VSSPSNAVVALIALALVLDPRPLKPVAPARLVATPAPAEADACALLTEEQVSAAIEAKALAGKHLVPTSTKQCIWSDDPNHSTDHRRVTLNIGALRSFDLGKSNPGLTTEAVSGVGDAAYYIIYKADAPTIVVRKGDSVFNLRILNGFKFKALTLDEERARELTLAKAAAAKI
jgi:hypothetical protein